MQLDDILEQVQQGRLEPREAARLIEGLSALSGSRTLDLGFASLDIDRERRTGFPEVVFGQNKTVEQIIGIVNELRKHTDRAIVTRIDSDKAQAVQAAVEGAEYRSEARMLLVLAGEIKPIADRYIAVVCAGSSDLPVAEEAAIIAECAGVRVERIYDVGVAGIHRLFARLGAIRGADAIVVVAGMEGALASVIGGLVSRPVVAVPTSVGYGANFQGVSALLSMLNACSPGIAVVNIDNGFGAGYYAANIVRTIHGASLPAGSE